MPAAGFERKMLDGEDASAGPSAQPAAKIDAILERVLELSRSVDLVQQMMAVSTNFDVPHTWAAFGVVVMQDFPQCGVEIIENLVLHTFRQKLRLPHVFEDDEKCLRWIAQLYLGLRPDDNQMTNLPYLVNARDDLNTRLSYTWGHVMALTDTLAHLRDMYHANCIHLLSRARSQDFLRQPGSYLVRMSNLDVGSIIISTNENHFYLNHRLTTYGIVMPRGVNYEVQYASYVNKQFVIYKWSVYNLQRFIHACAQQLKLLHPVHGAENLADLAVDYQQVVRVN